MIAAISIYIHLFCRFRFIICFLSSQSANDNQRKKEAGYSYVRLGHNVDLDVRIDISYPKVGIAGVAERCSNINFSNKIRDKITHRYVEISQVIH